MGGRSKARIGMDGRWRNVQTIGQLGTALTRVAAAQMPEATALRVRWTGQQVPAIYQMVSVNFAGNARDCADGSKSGAHRFRE